MRNPDKLSQSSSEFQGADVVPEDLTAWSYEATVTKVEAIIAQLESGKLELAEVFDQFAIAVQHLQQCETFLTDKQQQIDLLIETLLDPPANP